MKSAGFYMSIVASVIAISLVMAWMNRDPEYLYATVNSNFYREWTNISLYGLKVIVALAPVSMMMYFREQNWIRNLFLFSAVTVLIIAVYAMANLAHFNGVALPAGKHRGFVVLFGFAGVIAFVGACFCVQNPRIRTGFRWLAIVYLMEILAIFIWSLMRVEQPPNFRSNAIPFLTTVPDYVILFFLCYRAGTSDAARDQWEAAVDSIGSPEEDSDN